jgi:hypothetical protein
MTPRWMSRRTFSHISRIKTRDTKSARSAISNMMRNQRHTTSYFPGSALEKMTTLGSRCYRSTKTSLPKSPLFSQISTSASSLLGPFLYFPNLLPLLRRRGVLLLVAPYHGAISIRFIFFNYHTNYHTNGTYIYTRRRHRWC